MRAHSTVNKTYTTEYESGPVPTWMKSLEEKYKRLHMKIVFNASANRRRSRVLSAVSTRSARIRQNVRPTPIQEPKTAPNVSQSEVKQEFILKDAFENDDSETKVDDLETNIIDKEDHDSIAELSDVDSDNASVSSSNEQGEMKNSVRRKSIRKGSVMNINDVDGLTMKSEKNPNHATCPVSLQRQEPMLMREPTREELHYKSKLFQRMSKEAQTAITETRNEKKRQSLHVRRESLLLNNFTKNAKNNILDVNSHNSNENTKRSKSCVAVYSMSSSVSSSSEEEIQKRIPEVNTKRHLPKIVSARTESTFQSAGARNVLLPGVGRYKIPIPLLREQTFQVTGAEYDIRYRDVIRTDRRDSMTPPSDILEQAMLKCQQWLTKHVVCSTAKK